MPGHRPRIVSAIAVVSAVVIFSPTAFADTDSVRFEFNADDPTAEHEWTVPDGVTEVTVEAAGGGGGGAFNTATGSKISTDGGSGALVTGTVASTPGETFVIGVGGAGAGRRGKSGGGGGGGASIITATDVLVIAGGGGA